MDLPDAGTFKAWVDVLNPAGAVVGLLGIIWGIVERRRANVERDRNHELQERTRLGTYLDATPEQVQNILAQQRAGDARPFGQLMISLYGASETEIREALAQQREARRELALRRRARRKPQQQAEPQPPPKE